MVSDNELILQNQNIAPIIDEVDEADGNVPHDSSSCSSSSSSDDELIDESKVESNELKSDSDSLLLDGNVKDT